MYTSIANENVKESAAQKLRNRIEKKVLHKNHKQLRRTVILRITAVMCFILFSKIKINFNRAKIKDTIAGTEEN